MSYGGGFAVSPLSASSIKNFSTDVAAIVAQTAGTGTFTGVVTTDSIRGSGIVGDPLMLKDDVISVTFTATDYLSGNHIYSNNVSASDSITAGQFIGNGAQITNITASNISNFTSDTRAQFSAGTNINISSGAVSTTGVPTRTEVTGALVPYATLTGVSGTFTTPAQVTGAFSVVTAANATNAVTAQTASYVATSSAIATFTTDVRNQLSGSQYVTYNNSTGVFSLPNTGSTIGSTGVILGTTVTSLANLTDISATQITGTEISSSDFVGWGNRIIRPYGSFSDSTTQTASVSELNTPIAMRFDTTEYSNAVTIVSGTQLKVTHPGVYSIQFSALLYSTNNTTQNIFIWFRKNGQDIPRSTTDVTMTKNEKVVAAWNYVESANGGDNFEIMWATPVTDIYLFAAPTGSNPTRPAAPSVIATVTQV